MHIKIDRRVVKTKQAIFQSFISLIAEKHFEDITINEIADRANINRGTVYFHYSDKYDLLNKCIEENLNKMISATTTTNANGETVDLIQSSFLPVIRYFEEHHRFYASMLSNKGIPAFREQMLELVTTHIRININMDGDNSHYNQEFITQFMASAFVGIIEWWIMNDMPQSSEDVAEQLWGLLKRNQVIN
ncbi:TetR/AcrR family transcriptional regulator [Paenibacillus sp. LS1]|uniref:TetR/AcrR family transcriptional regulator n=1 Tax=Paenibacillus sp. LS1 TaxID=2992120 RepID=UPI00222E7D66|nr:TetR/AcrR family transcriptional regulator [Paenibacillus sp. LS1]MCW3790064.1 TetR/AcrR family transcriptional regulator [Paenibacillus sp. LS1]